MQESGALIMLGVQHVSLRILKGLGAIIRDSRNIPSVPSYKKAPQNTWLETTSAISKISPNCIHAGLSKMVRKQANSHSDTLFSGTRLIGASKKNNEGKMPRCHFWRATHPLREARQPHFTWICWSFATSNYYLYIAKSARILTLKTYSSILASCGRFKPPHPHHLRLDVYRHCLNTQKVLGPQIHSDTTNPGLHHQPVNS